MIIGITVAIGPGISSFYYSLTDWNGMGEASFIGLENFKKIFLEDKAYMEALVNNLKWLIFFLTVPTVTAIIVGSLLKPLGRSGLFFRTIFFLPYMISSIVVASIWRNLYSPTQGIGAQLAKLGIHGLDIALLGNPKTVLYAIAFMDNWRYWGFLAVLFLAAMQAISKSLYESARLEGANRWQLIRHVTIPGIRPTLSLMLLFSSMWSFLVFDSVWIVTRGGPAGGSMVLGVQQYINAFIYFDAGYAAAIGVTMTFYGFIFVLVFLYFRRKGFEI